MFCIIVSMCVEKMWRGKGRNDRWSETKHEGRLRETTAHLSSLGGSGELGLSGSLVGSSLLEESLRDGDLLKGTSAHDSRQICRRIRVVGGWIKDDEVHRSSTSILILLHAATTDNPSSRHDPTSLVYLAVVLHKPNNSYPARKKQKLTSAVGTLQVSTLSLEKYHHLLTMSKAFLVE